MKKKYMCGLFILTSVIGTGCSSHTTKQPYELINKSGHKEIHYELDDTQVYLSDRYRTRAATSAILGSYGKIVGEQRFYSKMSQIDDESNFNIRGKKLIMNSLDDFKKADINISTVINAFSDNTLQHTEKFIVKIEEVSDKEKLVNKLNQRMQKSQQFKNNIIDQNSRVVTSVVKIFGHSKLSSDRSKNGANINSIITDIVNVNKKKSSNEYSEIGDEVIIAYQFEKLCWNEDGNVSSLVIDYVGIEKCPNNELSFYPSSSYSSHLNLLPLQHQEFIFNLQESIQKEYNVIQSNHNIKASFESFDSVLENIERLNQYQKDISGIVNDIELFRILKEYGTEEANNVHIRVSTNVMQKGKEWTMYLVQVAEKNFKTQEEFNQILKKYYDKLNQYHVAVASYHGFILGLTNNDFKKE